MNRRSLVLVITIVLVAGGLAYAQEPTLTVKGTLKFYDGSSAPNVTLELVKMTADGREIIIQRGGKTLPAPASAKTGKDGKFSITVSKNEFGGMIMRFGFEAQPPAGGIARYGRTKEGKITVIEVEFDKDSVDLDASGNTVYVKKI